MAAAIVIVTVTVLLVWMFVQRRPRTKPLDPAEVSRLVQLKDEAVAYLENGNALTDEAGNVVHGYDEADKRFVELAQALPNEILPVRNLAICRVAAFEETDEEHTPAEELDAAYQRAQQAIESLHEKHPDSALTQFLIAKMLMKRRDALELIDDIVRVLGQATALDPRDLPSRYILSEQAKNSSDPAIQAQGLAALKEAHRIDPDNLRVLIDLLVAEAEARDPDLAATVEKARTSLAVLESKANPSGKDIRAQLDALTEAVKQQNWDDAVRYARFASNLASHAEVVKADTKRANAHVLAYVDYDFSDEFWQANARPKRELPTAINVAMKPIESAAALTALPGVSDLGFVDFDLDRRPDAIVLREQSVAVYAADPQSGLWRAMAQAPMPDGMRGMLIGDLDRDGSPDSGLSSDTERTEASMEYFSSYPEVVVFGDSGVIVLRNVRDAAAKGRRLAAVPQESALDTMRDVAAAALIDVDHDGDLDLVVSSADGISVWSNLGDGTLEDVSGFSQLPPAEPMYTSMAVVDWDRDVDLDVLLCGPAVDSPALLENLRHGRFRFRPLDGNFLAAGKAAVIDVLEADGNASWDVLTAGATGLALALTSTPRVGLVNHMRSVNVVQQSLTGFRLWDYDNDGYRDILAWGDDGVAVFRGSPSGEFTAVLRLFDPEPKGIVACDVVDLDGDGDLDAAIATASGVSLYRNEGGNANHYFALRVLGSTDSITGRVNEYSLGGTVEIKALGRYQAQTITRQTTHFGIGQDERAGIVRILLTNGIPQAVIQPEKNASITEPMILKGSCPFVYTWTGERFEFFTDLLWAAPLGLQVAEGKLAPDRPREYLKIPGDRLRLKDGRYRLQVTEELWEAGYFDQIELIAVDHPAEVEVFSNEKVGPAEIAAYKVHTVRERRLPRAARDSQGRDVLELIAQRDGRYQRGFARRLRQGLTPEHYLELDLGPLASPQSITLFLTGWIRPTDTSLNIAISQDPRLEAPRPPSIQVPDADGNWRETVPFMGYPGGKPKTIAVDLSHVFLTDDYRLRIVTTNEIYWDEAFFTVDEESAPMKLAPLVLESADLHYRGFSRLIPPGENGPDTFDYSVVSTEPQWSPMEGYFTRYGDVTPLLRDVDDRMVVMGAGDEMTVTFQPPTEELPSGWVRDFLINNVGWDKDADLNTVTGQSVEPLPFQAMSRYPYPPSELFPDTAAHREYLRTYQTRRQSDATFWRQIQQFEPSAQRDRSGKP